MRQKQVRIAPSILSADFAALGAAIAAAEKGGADLIHVDVMDGHFVPNITIGPPVVKSIKRVARVPLDVHLMIADPDRYAEAFVEAGADMLSVHVEVLPHLHRSVAFIKSLGVKAGVVLNPSTPALVLEEIAADVDFVLVMSVNPGFGGQKFIPRSLAKVAGYTRHARPRGKHERAHRDRRRHRSVEYRACHRRRRRDRRRRLRYLQRARSDSSDEGAEGRCRGGRVLMTAETLQTIDIRVRYAETDKMGVVYHANYFMWFEIGRCELLRAIGRSYREMEASGIGLPVIEAHCEYKSPARYDDELVVKTTGRLLSPARVEFAYEISRPVDTNRQRRRQDRSRSHRHNRAPVPAARLHSGAA